MQIQFVCQVRDNKKLGRKEYFTYHGLNRLEYSHFGAAPTPTAYTMKMSYDANGNIASKIMHSSISPVPLAHLSTYSYQDTGTLGKNYPVAPHAVSSAGGETYVYDAFGQVISGAGRSVQWTSYNKPGYIGINGDSRSFFDYGAGRARYQQLQESWNTGLAAWEFKRKINYHGTHFEQEILNSAGTQTKELHYILTPTGRSVTVETTDEDLATRQYRYLHQDHLGSVDAVTDGLGNLVSDDENSGDDLDLNYDPWGLRRDDQMQDTENYRKSSQRRGFTDHEHLDDLGLIHMNGRVYDPLLGRFLSPDVVVQSPSNTQSYNRYTYVRNNPLSFVDPTGYIVTGIPGLDFVDLSSAFANWGQSIEGIDPTVGKDEKASGGKEGLDSSGSGSRAPNTENNDKGNESNGNQKAENKTGGDANATNDEGNAGDSSGVINENAATTSTDGVPTAPNGGTSTETPIEPGPAKFKGIENPSLDQIERAIEKDNPSPTRPESKLTSENMKGIQDKFDHTEVEVVTGIALGYGIVEAAVPLTIAAYESIGLPDDVKIRILMEIITSTTSGNLGGPGADDMPGDIPPVKQPVPTGPANPYPKPDPNE